MLIAKDILTGTDKKSLRSEALRQRGVGDGGLILRSKPHRPPVFLSVGNLIR